MPPALAVPADAGGGDWATSGAGKESVGRQPALVEVGGWSPGVARCVILGGYPLFVAFCQGMLGLNNLLPTNGFSVLNQ